MKAIITADLHLGYCAFSATTDGRNTRSVDVELAWESAVEIVVAQQPDLVLIGGDIVHHPRVGTHAVMAWRDGVRRIVTETNAHLIAVAGNHDVARSRELLSPILIPDDYDRVHIVLEPKRIRLTLESGETASVDCFPFTALVTDPQTYKLEPDKTADVSCLLIHAAAQTSAEGVDKLPRFYAGAEAIDIGREAERYSIIAAGDFHTFHRLHSTALALYPGSIERTSSNIWAEPDPKGIVLCDTDAGSMEFLEIPTRPMFDYDFSGSGKYPLEPCAENINLALLQMLAGEEHRDAIVRLKIEDFPREDREHIDWGHVRELKSLTTHFYMDLRYAKRELIDLGDRRERPVATLADEAVAFFSDDEQPVRDCAMRYLDFEAEAVA
ncbi:hypothetical protein LCGC14_1355340 [marine sediment metagenome]|uniref:Calcineurin-like phosphoesterase domain-containing protein n=1 Tax=marine sediment metagenome TaxID=412755 RepID=A0A0F9NC02_9ZZZZ